MKTTLYAYSGTGNALAFARAMLSRIEGAVLRRIAKDSSPPEAGGRAVLVFPVIGWTLPAGVADFLDALAEARPEEVFAVATCSGTPAGTLLDLRAGLSARGLQLRAAFAVVARKGRGPSSFRIRIVRSLAGPEPGSADTRIGEIAAAIGRGEARAPERSRLLAVAASRLIRAVDGPPAVPIRLDGEACRGCGLCARVCPRASIRMEGGRPDRAGECDSCLACYTWCPAGALRLGSAPAGIPRYHHPAIDSRDMELRR